MHSTQVHSEMRISYSSFSRLWRVYLFPSVCAKQTICRRINQTRWKNMHRNCISVACLRFNWNVNKLVGTFLNAFINQTGFDASFVSLNVPGTFAWPIEPIRTSSLRFFIRVYLFQQIKIRYKGCCLLSVDAYGACGEKS